MDPDDPSPPPTPRPLGADRAEDVTPAMLGASRWQLAAFRAAVYAYQLSRPVTEREALATVWNGGDWRATVAVWADRQLDLADRLTGEAALAQADDDDGAGVASQAASPLPLDPADADGGGPPTR